MKMEMKHKISDSQDTEVKKKKRRKTVEAVPEPLKLEEDNIVEESNDPSHISDSQTVKKKKPRKLEPFWSTSKGFVAALKEENKINAVINWLQAIDNQQKLEKPEEADLTNEVAEELEDNLSPQIKKEDDQEEVSQDGETKKGRKRNKQKFGDIIAPYVDAFFRAGGTVSSLLACGRLEQSQLCSLFQALYHIMLRGNVLGEIDPGWITGECIEFLRLNADTTKHLLSTIRSSRQNQITLEFLLAMTAVDNQVAIEVLGIADLKETNVQYMANDSTIEVRKAYVNLITGLLVCGDPTLTRALLIKSYIVTSIIPSLVWDPADTAATFLAALRCHLVQNRSILKAKKSEIFNGETLTSLLRLYRWGGPANKPATLAHYSKKAKAKTARPFNEVDPAELELVVASVHSLLVTLLSDHTLGLVYKDISLGTKGQRNYLIAHVFRYVEKPWNIPALGELFVRTLTANPDVIKSVLQSMKSALEPRPTKEWTRCLDLVERVITGIHPEKLLEESLGELSLSQLMSVVVDLCVPQILVSVLCGANGSNLVGVDGSVTHRIAQFLGHMLDNLGTVYNRMVDWKDQGKLSQNDIMKVRRFVTEFLVRHFPVFATMLKACLAFMKAPDEMKNLDDDAPAASDTSILRLLLVYLKLCSRDDASVANADGENHVILMEMFDMLYVESDLHPYVRYDFYELMLALKEPSFVIENESRRKHIEGLFCDILSPDENISKRAKSVLVKLITNAGLFDANTDLPAIWLDIYGKHLKVHDVKIMMESVVRAASDPAGYRRKIEKADEKTVQKYVENERLEESLNAQLDEVCFLFDRWEEEESVLGTKGNLIGTASYELNLISPWLPALLDVVKEHQEGQTSKQLNRRQEFLKHLFVALLFHSSQPATLIRLVVKRNRRDLILPSDLMDYLKSWGTKGCPQPLFFRDHFISNITNFLIDEHPNNLDDKNFLRNEVEKSILGNNDKSVSRGEAMYLVRVVVFHVVELSQRGMLTSLIAARCGGTLCAVLSAAQQIGGNALRNCIQIFLANFVVFSEFSPSARNRGSSALNLTGIVIRVLQKISEFGEVANEESVVSALKEPFKQKLINALDTARKIHAKLHRNSSEAVVLFRYTFDEITRMLGMACEVPRDLWVDTTDMPVPSPWGIVVEHLLQVAAQSREFTSLPDTLVTKLSENIAAFNAANMYWTSPLERAFLKYLMFRPQQTKFVSKDLLPSILCNGNPCDDSEHLGVWLCQRFTSECLEYISKAINSEEKLVFLARPQLVLAAAKGAFSHLDAKRASAAFDACVPVIGKLVKNALTDENERPDWLASYVDFVVALLAKYKRFAVGKAALMSLLKSPPAVTVEKFFVVELIEKLFWNVCGGRAHPPVVLLYLKWLTVSLQKSEKKEEDILLISKLCLALLKKTPEIKSKKTPKDKKAVTWDAVIDSEAWMGFVPLAVMFGFQRTYIEDESKGVEARALVLRAFHQVCVSNFSYRADRVQLATIFKLIIKHSEFESCMTTCGPIRLELVKLVKLLVDHSPSLIEGEHFPLLLLSYRATVESADRLILQLLDKYESAGVVPPMYKSFLWGQDGASVYATMNVRNTLQDYDTNRVLSILGANIVQRTILNFPLNRSLDVHESYDSSFKEVYDPAFYLPIFTHMAAPESPLKTFAFVRSGALALTLVALASQVEEVRSMAYSILSGFVDHLYTSSGVQVEVLNRLMDSLRVGLTTRMNKDGSTNPRISSVVAIFLARTSMVVCNPLAPMYTTLNTFLLSKVEINVQSVPEFLVCMHGASSDFRDQRTWMLDVLCSGLRTEMDFQLCLNNEIPVFRLLMDMFTSCVTDVESKVRILKVITSAVALPSGASWLVFRYGLIAWLSSVCLFRLVRIPPIAEALVSLVQKLWKSLTNQSDNSELPIQIIKTRISCQLLRLLMSFVPMLPTMDSETVSAFLMTVEETYKAGHPGTSPLLTPEIIKCIIESSSQDGGVKCLSMLKFGGEFLLDDAADNLESLTKTWVSLASAH